MSTIAPHCPAGKSLFFDKLTHSNNGWSSATHTNYRHSLDVALGLFGKGSSPPINTDNVNSQKDQEDRRVRFDLVESDSWHWSPRRGYEKIVPSVRSQSINLDKIATLNNGGTLSGVFTDKVWWSVMPRTDEIELENTNKRRTDVIHVVSLVIAKELFSDDSLIRKFKPSFDEHINNESFSINNARSSECGIPEVMTCKARQEFPIETFNDSNGAWTDKGWNNAKTSNIVGLGNSVGQYANSDNAKPNCVSLGQLFHQQVILSICMHMSLSAGL